MLFFLLLAIFSIAISSQPLLVLFSAAVLCVVYKFFWRINEPKAIFFGLLLYWLSVIIKLFYADFFGLSFTDMSFSPRIVQTAYIAMLSLLVFSAGIKCLLPMERRELSKEEEQEIFEYDEKKVLIVYIISFVVKTFLNNNIFAFFGLGEVFNAFAHMRDAVIFIIIFIYYSKTGSLKLPIILLSIEVILSFFSFFSSFKDLIFSFSIAFLYFPLKFTLKQTIAGTIGIALTLYLLLTWQAIKGEYRQFLNGGEQSQTVVVERKDALHKFYELATNANLFNPDLWYGSVDRLSYIEFFSQASDNVPEVLPYENGQIWKTNIMHVLVPRYLNPNKKPIYDSEMINKYCTRKVAGAEVGVSFSLGFVAESYIDFGYVFMFIPVFLLGIFFGLIYRFILVTSLNHMWGCALVSPLWVYFNCNGTPGAKILGWMTMYVIIYYLFNKYLIKRIDSYMKKSSVLL